MTDLERLKALKTELQTRRETLAAEVATWRKCSDKAEWCRREAHLADVANTKARLKKANLEIVAEEQRLATERPWVGPRVEKPKKPKTRGYHVATTGEVIHRVARRLVRLLESLESPTEETQAFLPVVQRFMVHQEEHVAWQRRAWESRDTDELPDMVYVKADQDAIVIYAMMARDVCDALDMVNECENIRCLETLHAMLTTRGGPNTDHELNEIMAGPTKRRLDTLKETVNASST